MRLKKPYLEKLSQLAASDLLGGRPCERVGKNELDKLAAFVMQEASLLKFVYTAFDGDHQMFCNLMRQAVISTGKVPVNPDSVLGYKETLSFRQTKQGVLLDDLSVLRGCDELWVFTDLPAVAQTVPKLAEGVLIELLYFLKRQPRRPVMFLKISSLAIRGGAPEAQPWPLTYDETAACLMEDQKREILALANSGLDTDRSLRSVRYYLHDPLDYKYARFIRAEGYSEREVPLLPFLAVRIEDFADRAISLANSVVYWARLMGLASSCTKLAPLDVHRLPSQVVELLERVWHRRVGAAQLDQGDWTRFKVPKASQKDRWAITMKERATYAQK